MSELELLKALGGRKLWKRKWDFLTLPYSQCEIRLPPLFINIKLWHSEQGQSQNPTPKENFQTIMILKQTDSARARPMGEGEDRLCMI